jgi:hypothetical protein
LFNLWDAVLVFLIRIAANDNSVNLDNIPDVVANIPKPQAYNGYTRDDLINQTANNSNCPDNPARARPSETAAKTITTVPTELPSSML